MILHSRRQTLDLDYAPSSYLRKQMTQKCQGHLYVHPMNDPGNLLVFHFSERYVIFGTVCKEK
jgi:hypothetical protein